MAKRFIDVTVNTEKEAMTNQDGSALTLTGQVRVLFEDSATKADILIALQRIKDRINEILP
jgi:hypothetical protein